MRVLRIVLTGLAGLVMTFALLMWIAQFFMGEGESTPIIFLEQLQEQPEEESEGFGEFHNDDSNR